MRHVPILLIAAAVFFSFVSCTEENAVPGKENSMAELSIQANLVFFYYPDLDEAERFYTELLGFEKVLDYGFARICRISESTFIGLVEETKGMHDPTEPKTVTLSFVTDEIDGWYAYLTEQGVPMKGPVRDAVRHATRGFVALDPAGYFLEFERFLDHSENERLHAHLEGIASLYPVPGHETTRPKELGIRANVIWLYYRDIPVARAFYEDVFGASLLVEQSFAWVYTSSRSGFIGIVDESQGLHSFTERKAVNVSFLTDRIDDWYARALELDVRIKDPLEDSTSIPVRAFVGYDPAGYFIEFDLFKKDPRNDRILRCLK